MNGPIKRDGLNRCRVRHIKNFHGRRVADRKCLHLPVALLFGPVWLTLSAVGCFLAFAGEGSAAPGEGLPDGTLPFATIVLVGIFLAYAVILMVSLVTKSMGFSVAAIVGANIGTQIYLSGVTDLYGIHSVIRGPTPVWNGTVLTILAVQTLAIVTLIALTYVLQARKKDSI